MDKIVVLILVLAGLAVLAFMLLTRSWMSGIRAAHAGFQLRDYTRNEPLANKWKWVNDTGRRTDNSAAEHYAEAWAALSLLGVAASIYDRHLRSMRPARLVERVRLLAIQRDDARRTIAALTGPTAFTNPCNLTIDDLDDDPRESTGIGNVVEARSERMLPIAGVRGTSVSIRAVRCPACLKRMNVIARAPGNPASIVFRVACPECRKGIWFRAGSLRTTKGEGDGSQETESREVQAEAQASGEEGPGDEAA